MGFLKINKYDQDGKLLEPEPRRRKEKEVFYVRPISNPVCDCGDKRGKVYSLGHYIKNKYHALHKFCKVCFAAKIEPILSKFRKKVKLGEAPSDASDIEIVGWNGVELPDWLKLRRLQVAKQKPKVETIELLGKKVRVRNDYACPKCGRMYGCDCEGAVPDLGPPPKEKPKFLYKCQGSPVGVPCRHGAKGKPFETDNGLEAARHERETGHRCPPAGPKVQPGAAEKRRQHRAIEEMVKAGGGKG